MKNLIYLDLGKVKCYANSNITSDLLRNGGIPAGCMVLTNRRGSRADRNQLTLTNVEHLITSNSLQIQLKTHLAPNFFSLIASPIVTSSTEFNKQYCYFIWLSLY